MSYKLIKEYTEDYLTEAVLDESTGKKNWYIEGITLQTNIKNRNGRVYPKDVMKEALGRYSVQMMESGRAIGELNHPTENSASIDLKEVSHLFTEIREEGDNFITKAKVLDTPNGKIVQNLLEGGVKLGISSRGLGAIKEENGTKYVSGFHIVTLGDIVQDPSAPNAFLQGVLESVEYELTESGNFTIREVNSELDKYSRVIKEASKEQIGEAIKSILGDYTKKLFDRQ